MPDTKAAAARVRRWQLLLAFAAIYIIWGSTYLAIRFAVETIPPLLMIGTRSLIAGLVLYGWMRTHGHARLTLAEWRNAAVAGALLFLASHGLLAWAETRVASSTAALIGATLPLCMVLLEWATGALRPTRVMMSGLLIGLVGVAVLLGIGGGGAERSDLLRELGLGLATITWAFGALWLRHRPAGDAGSRTGATMITGGIMLLAASLLVGEGNVFSLATVSFRSVGALVYLIVFGSVVAFTAYAWLLRVSTPAVVGTHAYVNPVVALLLGALLGGEDIPARVLIGSGIILLGVLLTTVRLDTIAGVLDGWRRKRILSGRTAPAGGGD